jgi:hypothetical protein
MLLIYLPTVWAKFDCCHALGLTKLLVPEKEIQKSDQSV